MVKYYKQYHEIINDREIFQQHKDIKEKFDKRIDIKEKYDKLTFFYEFLGVPDVYIKSMEHNFFENYNSVSSTNHDLLSFDFIMNSMQANEISESR